MPRKRRRVVSSHDSEESDDTPSRSLQPLPRVLMSPLGLLRNMERNREAIQETIQRVHALEDQLKQVLSDPKDEKASVAQSNEDDVRGSHGSLAHHSLQIETLQEQYRSLTRRVEILERIQGGNSADGNHTASENMYSADSSVGRDIEVGGQLEDVEDDDQGLLLPHLKNMDFRNPADLKKLKNFEKYRIALPMFVDTEEFHDKQVAYMVRARDTFSDYLGAAERRNHQTASRYWETPEWVDWPSLLELSGKANASKVLPPFPKYVWEIGEIYIRQPCPESGGQWQERSSGYHLVLDATSSKKSIWRIFRRAEVERGLIKDKNMARKGPVQWHPFGRSNSNSCDAAQVFASIEDFPEFEKPNEFRDAFKKAASLVKQTERNMVHKTTFIAPELDEVKEHIEKSWR